MASYDVTVRGAGIFGLSIAWICASRGAKVCIVDPHGAANGSSGGIVGALAPHVPENWNAKKAFQLESLLMAKGFWDEVEATGGRSAGYARNGRLQPVPDDHALTLARQRADTAKTLWKDKAAWEVTAASNNPWQPASPSGFLIFDTLSALIHPRQACGALVAALRSRGVEVVKEAPDSGRVVWATGVAGLVDLTAQHSRSMGNGVKGQAALLEFDASGLPQLFAGGVHIIPHCDGTVAVGSTSEREYSSPDKTDDQLDEVIAQAKAAVPALADAPVIDRWAGVRPRSRSRAPMLGQWPDRPDHFIANGGFKIGFGMAPKVAHVMADLVLESTDTIPVGFRVEDNL
ncbi:FAD dependent oxidoreductase [Sulfitobacter noctilucicola]|uniref:Glycine oxidase n=1 Tax=Sulfitobacter noctilucicola TaxID=1342301 RepID=A0A7W6Q2E0_9RHOB|nr:FAD-binding oxidoreductase [Sulfitobacter noctilucicola]KIN62485.1 FAD dependent oxidoreductase [Sulfitobacter noctilucicola]MBB4172985.1 glycine oxidase [Sulfitobacter noctilucicola]